MNTSYREGLSMAMLEAMSCGLPCVVSNVGDTIDAAKRGYNSIVIVDFNDVNLFSKAVLKLLNDPVFYSQISANCRGFILENFSYANVTDTWEKILMKVQR